MKFLGNLFTIVFGLGMVVLIVVLVAPEVVAWVGAIKIRGEVAEVVALSRKPVNDRDCGVSGAFSGERPLSGYQLRFTSDTDYVLEAVCTSSLDKNVVVREGKLPWGVVKKAGYSGIKVGLTAVDQSENWLVVGRWGRYWAVGYKDGKVEMLRVWRTGEIVAGQTAGNTCTGWGYQCCSVINQVGSGAGVDQGVLDCPGNCFAVCQSRPAVTAFSSDPAPGENRVLYLSRAKAEATFFWKVQDVDGGINRVVVNFGDGQKEESSLESNGLVHRYNCSGNCAFTVTITAVDNDGLENNPGALLASMTVVVQ